MKKEDFISKVSKKVKEILENNPDQSIAHRYDHIERVFQNVLLIAKSERNVNLEILKIATLLHDIDQPLTEKEKHIERSLTKAKNLLLEVGYPRKEIPKILKIISEHSSEGKKFPQSIEAKILCDADKLDGGGALGIARVFLYCGVRGMTLKEAINWYKQKIKKAMPFVQTNLGKKLASEKSKYVEKFLKNLEKELTKRG